MAVNEPVSIVVCDAGPLIHLDELNCLDLLSGKARVLVPEIVWHEVQRHRPSALRHREVPLTRVSDIPSADRKLKRYRRVVTVHRGEQQALRLMQRFPNALLLTDDNAARKLAELLNYEVHGTIGVLMDAWRRGGRTKRQILSLLRTIPQKSTLHISLKLLNTVIAQVQGESHG
jgi:predicted nucleic acid-binding protein